MRKKVITVFSVLSLGLLGYNTQGQTKLSDLVNYTLAHSHDIKKSEYQCQEADYTRKEIRGKGLPQVEASASYSKMFMQDIKISDDTYAKLNGTLEQYGMSSYEQTVTGMLGMIDDLRGINMASGAIQVTQLIYSQSYLVGLKATKKTQELYTILREKNEEDVIAEVALGYYQAGSLMLQLQTVDKSINNLKEIHHIAELSYKNDLIKESQVNRLKVTITNLEVTRQTIQNGVTIQVNYLKALAGMPGDSTLVIDTTTMVNDFVRNDTAASFAVENVPAYKALLKQEDLYKQQVRSSQATYYPTLAAFGKISYSSYGLFFKGENKDAYNESAGGMSDLSNMNTIGLSFSMPLFTSGSTHAKVSQAKMKQFQLKEDIMKTKDLLSVNYNNAYLEYQTSSEMLEAQKENKALAQKVYNQTSMQFQEGMASMTDLLNVNSDFLQADNSLNQQILKCKTAEIKMLKASGNLKTLIK